MDLCRLHGCHGLEVVDAYVGQTPDQIGIWFLMTGSRIAASTIPEKLCIHKLLKNYTV
jgi:hypothetical protein